MGENDRYECWRSHNDKWLNVICRENTFDHAVPDKVRHRGPWTGCQRGLVSRLKSWNRHALEMKGYVVIRCHQMDFEPEAKTEVNPPDPRDHHQ